MTNLQTITQPTALDVMVSAGIVANHFAANSVSADYADYASWKAVNTLKAQLQDLSSFTA